MNTFIHMIEAKGSLAVLNTTERITHKNKIPTTKKQVLEDVNSLSEATSLKKKRKKTEQNLTLFTACCMPARAIGGATVAAARRRRACVCGAPCAFNARDGGDARSV